VEYQNERERLAVLTGHAQLTQPGGGVTAARAVVQALTATGEAFEYAMARVDEVRPELAASLPAWYTAIRAIGAECAIVAQWWTEELAREPMRWTSGHDARLAEDVEHFEQLRGRALDELEDRQPAAAFESVAVPLAEPWEENLPPRQRRWYLVAWPVLAAAVLGLGVYGFHAFETGHATLSGVLNGNAGPGGASALPPGTSSSAAASPSSTSAGPTDPTRTAAPSMTPVAAASSTTAQPAPRHTTHSAAPTTAAAVPQVIVTLVPADGSPQIEAYITVDTTTTAATTLYITEYGVTSSGKRTTERFSSQTLSGKTAYAVAAVVDTSAWCGDTVTVEATATGGSAAAQTGAGC
jgi:hypothetical protein